MTRIILVGGGTGGHFYPLIAIAEAIRERDQVAGTTTDLRYIGPEPYNQTALDALNISYIHCPAGKQRRYASIRNFFDKFTSIYGSFVAMIKLLIIYPDVIMSKGGFTSVPVVLAAGFLRIPLVIHDSDAVPGKANKIAAKLARYIAISYEDAVQFFPAGKTALTGIPIRKSFFTPIVDPRATLGITSALPIIFITGGSTGAERINNLILDSLDELLPKYILIHQAGEANEVAVKQTASALITDQKLLNRYFILGHMPGDIFSAAQSAASIIISRAGSGTIAEIALKGKPSIIIPIPEDISHDQRTNAFAYARTGAASVIEEENLTDGLLTAEITRILSDESVRTSMSAAAKAFTHPDAAYTLADTLLGIASEHEQ